jgi:tetratricopeptide (TPR) repeat protein
MTQIPGSKLLGIFLFAVCTIFSVTGYSADPSVADNNFAEHLSALQLEVEDLSMEYIDLSLDASSFMLDEEYDKAISTYTQALDKNQKLAKAYENMLVFLKEKSPAWTAEDEADFLNTLNDHKKDYVSIFSNRGNCYSFADKDELALQDYARAIELAPNSGGAYYHRSMYFVRKGQTEKAKADSVKLLEVDPGSPFAMMAQMMVDMY